MRFEGILVDHAALEQAAQDLTAAVKAIEGRLDQLDAELAPLRSDWVGSAQESYQAAKATWDRAMAEMTTLLAQTSAAVAVSNAEYRAADQRGAAAFQL